MGKTAPFLFTVQPVQERHLRCREMLRILSMATLMAIDLIFLRAKGVPTSHKTPPWLWTIQWITQSILTSRQQSRANWIQLPIVASNRQIMVDESQVAFTKSELPKWAQTASTGTMVGHVLRRQHATWCPRVETRESYSAFWTKFMTSLTGAKILLRTARSRYPS